MQLSASVASLQASVTAAEKDSRALASTVNITLPHRMDGIASALSALPATIYASSEAVVRGQAAPLADIKRAVESAGALMCAFVFR